MADGVVAPVADSDVDLGTSSLYWKNAYIDDVYVSGEVKTANIGYTDGDNAITIADGGGITAAAGITSTAAANTLGATSFNDANITNVGDIALDTISSDAGTSIGITLGTDSGDDFIVATSKLVVEGDTGRVGIGTATPSSSLEIESSSGDQIFEMDNNASNSANFQIQNGAGNSRVDLVMNDGSANTTITLKGQKVGILDTSPSYTLDVTGTGQFTSDLIVGGNLTVNGTTTTVNTATITVEDPVIKLGQSSSDDNKDRGVEFAYNDGSARLGFMGWDDSASGFTMLSAASNSSEVFSGTAAPLVIGALTAASLDISGDADIDGAIASGTTLTAGTDLTVTGGDIIFGNGQNATIDVADSSGTNTTGRDLILQAGAGTGTGLGGYFYVKLASGDGSSGSSVNGHDTVLTISPGSLDGGAGGNMIYEGATLSITPDTASNVDANIKLMGPEGRDSYITFYSDDGDDAGDKWRQKSTGASGLLLQNDIASKDSFVTQFSYTPHATATSGYLSLAGSLKVGSNIIQNSEGTTTITMDTSENITVAGGVVATGASTFNGAVTLNDDVSIESGTSAKPVLQLLNTNADGNGSTFKFNKNGASVADGDVIGNLEFVSEDDGSNVHTYAKVIGSIDVDAAGEESGKLQLQVASHDGGVEDGLILVGGSADTEVDVTIGKGTASVTTVAGQLDVASGIEVTTKEALTTTSASNTAANSVSGTTRAGKITVTLDGAHTISNGSAFAIPLSNSLIDTDSVIVCSNSNTSGGAMMVVGVMSQADNGCTFTFMNGTGSPIAGAQTFIITYLIM
jgi:hypothetical protein